MSLVKFKTWLAEDALPLWLERGLANGHSSGFTEALDFDGNTLNSPQRVMVQARQLYSFRTAMENGWLPEKTTKKIIEGCADFLIQKYKQPNGSFAHSWDKKSDMTNSNPDLYSQAFVLFGMASAFAVTRNTKYRTVALELLHYLNNERRHFHGGFIEKIDGQSFFQANPHMHLLEATLSWREIDSNEIWESLANEIYELCTVRFIDPTNQFLAEHFDESWHPIRKNGLFVAEPGHLYEWSWLLNRYESSLHIQPNFSQKLLLSAMRFGQTHSSSRVIDEVWSDGTAKAETSRLWPQCEKIKCLALLYKQLASGPVLDLELESQQANTSLNQPKEVLAEIERTTEVLMKYFNTDTPGLWFDRLEKDGTPRVETVKASSFYHIMGAAVEVARCLPG